MQFSSVLKQLGAPKRVTYWEQREGPGPGAQGRGRAGGRRGRGRQWERPLSLQGAVLAAVGEWEARHARALREREARARREPEQQLLTYTREDACRAVRVPEGSPYPRGRAPQRCPPAGAQTHRGASRQPRCELVSKT